ncbi:MAG TPA: zinc-dependent metalloprotease, partial [Polyangia bacterium]
TVTDAPPTSGIMFIGQSSELMKIKFDIQENFLYARRAYEQVADSEDAYKQDPAKYAGQPLAAWPIKSQFDIIRDYNSTTGEETNKIIESTERPWDEREFIRVDWSSNQVTDYVGLGVNFFFDDATVSNVSYWESDPTKPDALHFERSDGQTNTEFDAGEANYFDITNKLAVNPTEKQVCYEENGTQSCFTVPACFLRQQLDDCATQVVNVRHAFTKISPKHDYQPRNWDGLQMNLFGIWDVGLNRLTYNRQYGVTNTGIKRHAARFNIWQKSYQDDGKTPIPYNQRTIRTIPYYAESSLEPFPPELFDQGKQIVGAWNKAVKCAAADVMGFVGADQQCDPTQIPQDIFVWCHNPVKIGVDPDACKADLKPQLDAKGNVVLGDDGNPILRARQGDPRRSTIFWVNQFQSAGPLGYGPPLFDIESGETISGQAYIYGGALDTYAARSRDLVELLLGNQSPEDFVAGANIKDWVTSNRAGASSLPQTHSADEVRQMYHAMDFSWALGQAPQAPLDTSSPTAFMNSWKNREDAMYKSNLWGQSQADLPQVRRDKLKGSQLEAMMITPDIMAMGGAAPATDWTALSEAEKARVSPLRSEAVRKAINDRMDTMRAFGVDFTDFADEGVAQRALQIAQDPNLSSDPEAVRQQLRKDIFLAVTLHEVGHNMGLRHNFRASFDAMNYFKQYWDLRAQAAANPAAKKFAGIDLATKQPIGVAYAGTDCAATGRKGTMRPRYVDCPGGATSVDEVAGNVREYQYSSVMDYGAEFNSDLQGLGRYDKAAMKFSYAGDGFVEVFPTAKLDNTSQGLWASVFAFQASYGLPSALDLLQLNQTGALVAIPYTSYPKLFSNGAAGLDTRVDVPYSDITAGGPGSYVLSDSMARPMAPYYFCSDEFVGNLTCQRFDSGADAFEQAQDLVSRYKNFYLLNNFKRDRYTFHTSLAYKDRISSRYLDMLRQQMTWYVLLRADFTDLEAKLGAGNPGSVVDSLFASEDSWGSFTTGVTAGFDLLGQIITQPEAGTFVQVKANVVSDFPVDVWMKNSDTTTPGLGGTNGTIIGLLDGKFIDTTWDFTGCGYYWADECQTRIGYFVDKTVALDVLSQSQAYFTGRDTSTDVRKYAIGYILPFKNQIQEKIGALLASDFTSIAPYFNTGKTAVNNPGWALDSANLAARGTPADLIDPAGGFTLQLYAGLYGLSAFPTTFDHSFVDTTRIFVVGNGEAPVPDSELLTTGGTPGAQATNDPTQLVSHPAGTKQWFIFTDVASGKTYAAQATPQVKDGSGTQTYRNDTGVRMLETALTLQGQANTLCTADPTSP